MREEGDCGSALSTQRAGLEQIIGDPTCQRCRAAIGEVRVVVEILAAAFHSARRVDALNVSFATYFQQGFVVTLHPFREGIDGEICGAVLQQM